MNSITTRIKSAFANKEFVGSLIAIVLFAIIAWAYFLPDALEGNVLKQHDVMQGMSIGQEVKAYHEATGEDSRWTNSLFSGMPNFQISPTYKSSVLVSWIGKAYSLGFPAPVNLLFIMMLGFYILLKSVRVRWYLAIPGAIAWGFSTYFFIIIGAGHIWKYITLAYVPPTIAGIIWAYRGKYFSGSVIAALFATLQISGNHVQMSYYFMMLIAGLVIAFFVILRKESNLQQWSKATCCLVLAGIVAILANSPNLYNTYKYSKETMRGGHSELVADSDNSSSGGLNKDYITQWSYGTDELLTLLVPNAKGGAHIKPEKGSNKPLLLSETNEAKKMLESGELDSQTYQALGSFYQYFGDQPITNGPVYVGAFIFALFIFGCFVIKGALKWCIVAVTIITVLLSLGHNMMWWSDLFIDYFPMYNKFRTVSSILVVAELTMPLLAIMGLQQLISNHQNFNAYKKSLYISFGISALLCAVLLFAPSMLIGNGFPAEEYKQYASQGIIAQYPQLFDAIAKVRLAMVSSDALRSLLVLAVAFALILLYGKSKMSAKVLTGAMTVLLLIDMFAVNKRYLNTDSFTTPLPESQALIQPRNADLQILQDTAMNYRVMDLTKFSEAMPSYFHKAIGGYHAAKLARYQDIIDHHIAGSEGMNPEVLNMLNAKYFIVDDNTAQLNPDAYGNAWFVDKVDFVDTPRDEISALSNLPLDSIAVADKRFINTLTATSGTRADGDTIFETSYAPNRLSYHYSRKNPGVAVFSEVYFPWGWKATIDGTPVDIARVNYILRALNVPAGNHSITFEFDPESVKITETLAFIAIAIIYIGLIVILIFTFRRCKKCDDKKITEPIDA